MSPGDSSEEVRLDPVRGAAVPYADQSAIRPETASVSLRQEQPRDYGAIRAMVETAFLTAEHAEGDEQDFVERQRAGRDYVPELALIAEVERTIIGHIMMTRLSTISGSVKCRVLLVAELAVALPLRRLGIASLLIEEATRRAKALGYDAQVLVGDPGFYRRFGFVPTTEFRISNANGIESQYVLARELWDGALADQPGTLHLPE